MRFQDTDVLISMSYDLDMFSSMYIFLFGSHNLEPDIDNFFSDFDDFEVLEIDRNNAVIFARNVSRINGAYYLYDSHELNGTVDVLLMVLPNGDTNSFIDASSTEATFYDV
ncbi:hypothetical protein FKV42_02965 [Methanolobus vulcani]|uniref:Uncharacterized protein n=2 Tax=Methanolobus vulcani TaxID=38026 RepID=A0A7Z8P251_9EURY|nr:hypothetical protein FKV42_02965 [Methanolobus vulcani]